MAILASGVSDRDAFAQLGALVSPGRLTRAHASLEGITGCLSCHAAGQGVSAKKCLSCHAPIEARMAQKKGVHRNVTTDCVSCHVEHAGVDAELRPFDERRFDHAAETGFPLDGLHKPVACSSCHKTRSFLSAKAACVSCHTDVHKGSLGTACANCHPTSVAFKDTRQKFNHGRTAFALTGAHTAATCVSCHKGAVYSRVAFASCASCHTSPHREAFAAPCASCHTTAAWRTTRVDHARTAFPLRGLHAAVECTKCHTRPALEVTPASKTCATCHTDPHRPAFKQDCAACHNESGWQKGAFDHATTRFQLADKHAGVPCVSCHTAATSSAAAAAARGAAVPARGAGPARGRATAAMALTSRTTDFSGLRAACASCHADVHAAELGTNCENCHTARTFGVTSFTHARSRAFFGGRHEALVCVRCHVTTPSVATAASTTSTRSVDPAQARPSTTSAPRMAQVGLTTTSDACASCHRDVHAGQVSTRCETCHTLETPKFAVTSFAHDKTTFPLTGKHVATACSACHKVETGRFPAGAATTRRLTGMGNTCASCHEDKHAGQLTQGCERCHSSETFAIARYPHLRARTLGSFFVGRHASATCASCHKPGAAAAGRPATPDYRTSTSCVSCHTDVHRGALGPRCENCHRP